MTSSFHAIIASAGLILLATSTPVLAELPPPVRAMLDDVIANGSDAEIAAISKYAKKLSPGDEKEIDALVGDHKQAIALAEEKRKREAGFLGDWHGTGEAGGFVTTGNSETSGFTAAVNLNKTGIDWRHKFRAIVDYQRGASGTTRNQWLMSYEPNYNIGEHLYVFGLTMYEKDRFQGFSDRVTLSGGVGYRAIDDARATLDLKLAPAWRRTNWIEIPDQSDFSGLAGADFVLHINSWIDLTENGQILWGSDNSTFSSTAGLRAKFNRAFSARLSYGWRHETNPPNDTKKTDTVSRVTLVYGF